MSSSSQTSVTVPAGVDVLALRDLARAIAVEAGALAQHMRVAGIGVASTKSNRLDIVTQADTAVESLIRDRLAKARVDDGFIGEESGAAPGTTGITWIVDPIDGTVNYLYGSPYYAVSIAAAVRTRDGHWRPVAACVYAPALRTEYTAAIGHPAHRDGTLLRTNDNVPMAEALVSTGVPYDLARRHRVLEVISALAPEIRDVRLAGAASLDICGVAEGRHDAHYQRGLPIWDYAAASLIAAQAGAVVRGAGAWPAHDELLLVAVPSIVDSLETLLR